MVFSAVVVTLATLTSSSMLQLRELTCARVKPATATLSLADSNGVERLGISAGSAVFSAPVSAPSIDVAGSAVIGSSMILAGPLYLNGTDLATTLSGKQAALTTSSARSVASVAAATVTATTGMTITGGRGGIATWGAQLRVVSSNSSILTAPSIVYWGVNNEDHQCWE